MPFYIRGVVSIPGSLTREIPILMNVQARQSTRLQAASNMLQDTFRFTLDRVAKTSPVVWLASSSKVQETAFSPAVQRLQQAVVAMPQLEQIRAFRPVRLAEHYLEILAAVAVPEKRRHRIAITALQGSNNSFFLLRRHEGDNYEAGRLDNATGHVDGAETYEQTAIREIKEETGLKADSMIESHDARLHDFGNFGWLMHLRTPNGLEPSIVFGRMFLFQAPDLTAKDIKIRPDEHMEVIELKLPEIMKTGQELCVWNQFYFTGNQTRLPFAASDSLRLRA